MSDTDLAEAGPLRHGLLEGALGGLLALVAITVAQAALPDPARPAPHAPSPRVAAVAQLAAAPVAAPAAPPVAPAVLIAFQAPLPDGQVGSPFGLRQLPWEDHARLHAGVDLDAPGPEPVLAAADGVVTRLGQDPGYGRFVELRHAQGLVTRYGHLERFAQGLAPGDAVKAGAPVGQLGSTGTSTGPHLHFEVRDADDRPMNPEMFLGRAFATAADLPLKAALRTPRLVRLAYVSRIPKAKQAQMQARLSAQAAGEAADAGEATEARSPLGGVSLPRVHGRVHMRLQLG
ncbi:M23 family metallopeptidase [Phenylobacterium sp.]|uniref:M23 family metallopeptidase n=1 Tax=Phenylobacterium sp. TaxID=1871053 RepID=UPI002DF65DE4|nr:M23 family metallopeptidase [Phenylobacterium sp.]